jgi:NUMOD3 motif
VNGRRTARARKHGHARKGKTSLEYNSWAAMIQRCTNPKTKNWASYGGRGITICDRWRTSSEAFLADMGPKPSPKHSLDRWPDNAGNYEPGNCRWATGTEQRLNQRPRAPLSPEHRAKIGAAQRGKPKPMSAETRAKLSVAHRGKSLSPEHCSQISARQKGKPKSPEHMAKLRAGRWPAKQQEAAP